MQLTDFKVLTFDCYGTLIDWETGMFEALKPLVGRIGEPLSRDRILEAHARHEPAQQLATPADGLAPATDLKADFLGHLNRIYGKGEGMPSGGLKGDYGFIVE